MGSSYHKRMGHYTAPLATIPLNNEALMKDVTTKCGGHASIRLDRDALMEWDDVTTRRVGFIYKWDEVTTVG